MTDFTVYVTTNGQMSFVFGPEVPAPAARALADLGDATVVRSHVEPADDFTWTVDLRPLGGPVLEGFTDRGVALAAERKWVERHLQESI